jgi:hypothetical protein
LKASLTSSTTAASTAASKATASTIQRRSTTSTPAISSAAIRRWARGRLMVWVPSIRICLPFSSCPMSPIRRAGRPTGRTAFYPPTIRARRCGRRARRFSTWPRRPA